MTSGTWSSRTFRLEESHLARIDAIRLKGKFKSRSAVIRWLLNQAYKTMFKLDPPSQRPKDPMSSTGKAKDANPLTED